MSNFLKSIFGGGKSQSPPAKSQVAQKQVPVVVKPVLIQANVNQSYATQNS